MRGWAPPGTADDPTSWSYDLQHGWKPPGQQGAKGGTQAVMGADWNPRNRGLGWSTLLSPPGTAAPKQAINWTPDTQELHAPGAQAPVDKTNLSIIPEQGVGTGQAAYGVGEAATDDDTDMDTVTRDEIREAWFTATGASTRPLTAREDAILQTFPYPWAPLGGVSPPAPSFAPGNYDNIDLNTQEDLTPLDEGGEFDRGHRQFTPAWGSGYDERRLPRESVLPPLDQFENWLPNDPPERGGDPVSFPSVRPNDKRAQVESPYDIGMGQAAYGVGEDDESYPGWHWDDAQGGWVPDDAAAAAPITDAPAADPVADSPPVDAPADTPAPAAPAAPAAAPKPGISPTQVLKPVYRRDPDGNLVEIPGQGVDASGTVHNIPKPTAAPKPPGNHVVPLANGQHVMVDNNGTPVGQPIGEPKPEADGSVNRFETHNTKSGIVYVLDRKNGVVYGPTSRSTSGGGTVGAQLAQGVTSTKLDSASPSSFIASLAPKLKAIEAETGISAVALLAISANETGWGKSEWATKHNNLFGHEQNRQSMHFASPDESIAAMANLVKSSDRYKAAYAVRNDPVRFIQELKKAGYAEDDEWVGKITSIEESVKANPQWEKATPSTSASPTAEAQKPTPAYAFPVVGYEGAVQAHGGTAKGGADIMAPEGTQVVAMRGGKVTHVGFDKLGGNNVLIQGDDGNQYYYAHLNSMPSVDLGAVVKAGQALGQVGNTGNAAGGPTHLHIGIGPTISQGAGADGGVGEGFDAVTLLQQAQKGTAAAPGAKPASATAPPGLTPMSLADLNALEAQRSREEREATNRVWGLHNGANGEILEINSVTGQTVQVSGPILKVGPGGRHVVQQQADGTYKEVFTAPPEFSVSAAGRHVIMADPETGKGAVIFTEAEPVRTAAGGVVIVPPGQKAEITYVDPKTGKVVNTRYVGYDPSKGESAVPDLPAPITFEVTRDAQGNITGATSQRSTPGEVSQMQPPKGVSGAPATAPTGKPAITKPDAVTGYNPPYNPYNAANNPYIPPPSTPPAISKSEAVDEEGFPTVAAIEAGFRAADGDLEVGPRVSYDLALQDPQLAPVISDEEPQQIPPPPAAEAAPAAPPTPSRPTAPPTTASPVGARAPYADLSQAVAQTLGPTGDAYDSTYTDEDPTQFDTQAQTIFDPDAERQRIEALVTPQEPDNLTLPYAEIPAYSPSAVQDEEELGVPPLGEGQDNEQDYGAPYDYHQGGNEYAGGYRTPAEAETFPNWEEDYHTNPANLTYRRDTGPYQAPEGADLDPSVIRGIQPDPEHYRGMPKLDPADSNVRSGFSRNWQEGATRPGPTGSSRLPTLPTPGFSSPLPMPGLPGMTGPLPAPNIPDEWTVPSTGPRTLGEGQDVGYGEAPATPEAFTPPIDPSQIAGGGNKFGDAVSMEGTHNGTDLQATKGTPALSPVEGIIVNVEFDQKGLGLQVTIQDEQGQEHKLSHLDNAPVRIGEHVQPGQPVGHVGESGDGATGPHLDYRIMGADGEPKNPEPLLGPLGHLPLAPGTVGEDGQPVGAGEDAPDPYLWERTHGWRPDMRGTRSFGSGQEAVPMPEGDIGWELAQPPKLGLPSLDPVPGSSPGKFRPKLTHRQRGLVRDLSRPEPSMLRPLYGTSPYPQEQIEIPGLEEQYPNQDAITDKGIGDPHEFINWPPPDKNEITDSRGTPWDVPQFDPFGQGQGEADESDQWTVARLMRYALPDDDSNDFRTGFGQGRYGTGKQAAPTPPPAAPSTPTRAASGPTQVVVPTSTTSISDIGPNQTAIDKEKNKIEEEKNRIAQQQVEANKQAEENRHQEAMAAAQTEQQKQAEIARNNYTNALLNQADLTLKNQSEVNRHTEAMATAKTDQQKVIETIRHNAVQEVMDRARAALDITAENHKYQLGLLTAATDTQKAQETSRHNYVSEQQQRQQMQSDARQKALDRVNQVRLQGTFGQRARLDTLKSALANPWMQALSNLAPGFDAPGGPSGKSGVLASVMGAWAPNVPYEPPPEAVPEGPTWDAIPPPAANPQVPNLAPQPDPWAVAQQPGTSMSADTEIGNLLSTSTAPNTWTYTPPVVPGVGTNPTQTSAPPPITSTVASTARSKATGMGQARRWGTGQARRPAWKVA